MIGILVPDLPDDAFGIQLRKMAELLGDHAYVSLCLRRRQNDQLRLHEISNLAARFKVKTVVTNDVLFHEPGRRQLQDIVTCIRTRTTRSASSASAMPIASYREALARTVEIVARAKFSLEELTDQYPEEAIVPGKDAQASLEHYVWQCIPDRYPEGMPPDVLPAPDQ